MITAGSPLGRTSDEAQGRPTPELTNAGLEPTASRLKEPDDLRKGELPISVNGNPVNVVGPLSTGLEIKEGAIEQGVAIELDFVLARTLPDDKQSIVGDDDKVDVTEFKTFIAVAADDKGRIEIIVNTRPRIVTTDELSYDEVIKLAFDPPPTGPHWEIVVSYRNGAGRPPDGRLRPGGTVKVQEGTVFNVTATDKS